MQTPLLLEDTLFDAMTRSDTDALNRLLTDGLLFINHLGFTVTKSQDIEMHRSGTVKIDAITRETFNACCYEHTIIVDTCIAITGSYAGQEANGRFHHLRTWVKSGAGWQVAGLKTTLL